MTVQGKIRLLLIHLLDLNVLPYTVPEQYLKFQVCFQQFQVCFHTSVDIPNDRINCHPFCFTFYIRRISFCNFFFAVPRFIKIFSLTFVVVVDFQCYKIRTFNKFVYLRYLAEYFHHQGLWQHLLCLFKSHTFRILQGIPVFL